MNIDLGEQNIKKEKIMALLSTQRCIKDGAKKSGTQKLSYESIFAEGKLQDLVIVSAFTDIDFIKKAKRRFIRSLDKRSYGRFAVYLDASASRYYSSDDVKKKLDDLAKSIKSQFNEKSGIYLVNCSALFHSKVIISESASENKITLGSINFTNRAFEQNEEIALSFCWKSKDEKEKRRNEVALKNNLEKYISSLKAEKIPIKKKQIEMPSVRSQLLKGSLYYELKEQNSFRFSLNLPDSYLKYRNKRRDNDDTFPLAIKTSNAITLEYLLETLKIKLPFFEENSLRKKWKSYAIETCFGFWVPLGYRQCVDNDIKKVMTEKLRKMKDLFDKVSEQKNEILNVFVEKLNIIKADWKFFIERSGKYDETWRLQRNDDVRGLGKEWLESVLTRINPEEKKYEDFRIRLCKGVDETKVPDVWSDDPASAEDFEKSLCDSIKYYLSTKNKQMKKICSAVNIVLGNDMTDLSDKQVKDAFCKAKFVDEEK